MADEVIYDVNLSPSLQNATVSSILPDIRVVFDSVLTQVRPSDIRDTDMARIYISHPDLNVPITVSPRVWANIDSTTIMDKLEHVLTSKTSLRTDDTFRSTWEPSESREVEGNLRYVQLRGLIHAYQEKNPSSSYETRIIYVWQGQLSSQLRTKTNIQNTDLLEIHDYENKGTWQKIYKDVPRWRSILHQL